MKHYVLLFFFLSYSFLLRAQIIDRPTLSSGGTDFLINGSVSIQSTLGETVIETVKLGNTRFTQGFQQHDQYIKLPTGRGAATLSDLLIFPNPAVDQVNIKFNMIEAAMVRIVLYNKSGKMVAAVSQFCSIGMQEIPLLFNVPSGLYVLDISYKGYSNITKILVQ